MNYGGDEAILVIIIVLFKMKYLNGRLRKQK